MKTLMYARFERFWHWSQAILVISMLITGFEIHGSYSLLGFERATSIHGFLAWILIGLWIFAWFWHLTTGEWKQYIPSTVDRIIAQFKYYAFGIFQGKAHPFHKDRSHKLNPLQRMAYLSLHILIGPAIWASGLLYLFYNDWSTLAFMSWLPIGAVAFVHTAAAFLMLTFLVAHLYLALAMDDRPFASLKAMVSGYESDS